MTDKEIYGLYTEWQQPFKELFSQYKGKTESKTLGSLSFTNKNMLDDRGKQRKVECEIIITYSYIVDPKRFSVRAEEKTYEILGGSSCGSLTEEEALNQAKRSIERYQFEHIDEEQLSLW